MVAEVSTAFSKVLDRCSLFNENVQLHSDENELMTVVFHIQNYINDSFLHIQNGWSYSKSDENDKNRTSHSINDPSDFAFQLMQIMKSLSSSLIHYALITVRINKKM